MSVSESSSMPSQPSRSSPSTAARSPQKAAQPIKDGRCDYEPISPHAAFSLNRQPSSPHAVTFGPRVEGKPSERQGTPSDSTLVDMANTVNPPGNSLSKRKSQFYGEVFAYREPNVSARDRIHQFSIITVEVKTNVIVKDEYVFLTDLSQQLSQRYNRPVSSIFVTLAHSACLLFAGTFDSAYILTVTALPSQIQPTTNKRNAALIQNFMIDVLGVPAERGVVRFVGIADEYLATNGMTVLSEIENLRKTSSEQSRTESSRLSTIRTRGRRTSKPPESSAGDGNEANSGVRSPSPPVESHSRPSSLGKKKSFLDIKMEKGPKMGRRQSFMALFGK